MSRLSFLIFEILCGQILISGSMGCLYKEVLTIDVRFEYQLWIAEHGSGFDVFAVKWQNLTIGVH